MTDDAQSASGIDHTSGRGNRHGTPLEEMSVDEFDAHIEEVRAGW